MGGGRHKRQRHTALTSNAVAGRNASTVGLGCGAIATRTREPCTQRTLRPASCQRLPMEPGAAPNLQRAAAPRAAGSRQLALRGCPRRVSPVEGLRTLDARHVPTRICVMCTVARISAAKSAAAASSKRRSTTQSGVALSVVGHFGAAAVAEATTVAPNHASGRIPASSCRGWRASTRMSGRSEPARNAVRRCGGALKALSVPFTVLSVT